MSAGLIASVKRPAKLFAEVLGPLGAFVGSDVSNTRKDAGPWLQGELSESNIAFLQADEVASSKMGRVGN